MSATPEGPGPESDLTTLEFYHSVTGEERGLVGRVFKKPLAKLSTEDPETWIEALVFLDLHRRRDPDAQGKARAMNVGDLQSYFTDDSAGSEDASGEA